MTSGSLGWNERRRERPFFFFLEPGQEKQCPVSTPVVWEIPHLSAQIFGSWWFCLYFLRGMFRDSEYVISQPAVKGALGDSASRLLLTFALQRRYRRFAVNTAGQNITTDNKMNNASQQLQKRQFLTICLHKLGSNSKFSNYVLLRGGDERLYDYTAVILRQNKKKT